MFITNVLKSRPPGQPRPPAGRDRRLQALPAPPGRADRAERDLHARQLRHQAADPLAARHHGRARPPAGARAGRADGARLPALPPGGRAAQHEDARGAARGLRSACPALLEEPPPVPIGAVAPVARRGRAASPSRRRSTCSTERASGRESAAAETEAAGAELAAPARPGRRGAGQRRARQRQDHLRARRLPRAGRRGAGHQPDLHRRATCWAARPEVAHLDLYRLGSLAGEDPALLDDYLTPERIAFVEWPGVAEAGLRAGGRARAARAPGRRPPRGSTIDVTALLGHRHLDARQRGLRAARGRRELRGAPAAGPAGRAARRTRAS